MNIIILPYRFGTEDHKIVLVNFKQSDVVGFRVKIYSLGMRRLICENKVAVKRT